MKQHYITLALSVAIGIASHAQQASFDHPTELRYLGTIDNTAQKPVCNLTTRNPINNGAFLWAPAGSSVTYTDTSTGSPKEWKWETSGGVIENPMAQNASVRYADPGTYDFPKLTVSYPAGEQTASTGLKLKVGGVAELCLADCREWLTTYALGCNTYDNQNGALHGSLGGTNNLDIVGVGNLFMTAIEDGFIDGVNVYLPSKPTKWKDGAKIGIRIWMVNMGENDVQLAGIPLEGSEIKFENIKTADDGVWVPVQGGAVVSFKCTEPIDLFGKPLIFIDVYGWSNDPSTEDFKMLMDVMPNRQMRPEDAQNKLAHNSFVRLKGEDDYLRPVSYFGGNYGSCMICPLVRGGETPLGSISGVAADHTDNPMTCRVENGSIILTGADGAFGIFNMSGIMCHSGQIVGGAATIAAPTLPQGIYIARDNSGQTVKFVIK